MAVLRSTFKKLADQFVNDTFKDFINVIEIQKLSNVPDGQGGFTSTWTKYADAKAFVKHESGDRNVETTGGGSKIDTNRNLMFQFQYISGIDFTMRIKHKGSFYKIIKPDDIFEVDVWTMVLAEKGEPT